MPKDLGISVLLDFYGATLTEKQRNLVDLYYNQDFSLSEIAENEAMTRQGVRDGIKRAEYALKQADEKLGLVSKSEAAALQIDKIIKLAQKISDNAKTDAAKKAAKQIETAAKKIKL